MQPSDEMAAAQVAIFAVVVGVFAVFAAFITFHFVNRRDQQPIKARCVPPKSSLDAFYIARRLFVHIFRSV